MNNYFKQSEFDSPDEPGSGENMSPKLLDLLNQLRELCGFPIVINSGFRTAAHNKAVGGSPTSSHLKGLAVDMKCENSSERFKMILNLQKIGITRFGVGKTFIHADIDESKAQNVVWLY